MSNLWLLVKKDFLEMRRSKKLLVLLILFLFVAITSPITAKMLPQIIKWASVPGISITIPEPTYKDALDQFIKNISQIGMLVLIFLAAGAVAEEKSRKSLEMLLTKPITRRQFILSKFITYLGVTAVLFIGAAGIFYLYTVSLFSGFNLAYFLIVAAMVLLYILMLVAITISASTICKSSLMAAGIGFLFFVSFSIVSSLASKLSKYLPDRILNQYVSVLNNGWDSQLFYPIVISLLLLVAAIWTSVIHFRYQEIER